MGAERASKPHLIGIDIGGTGVKAGVVDIGAGALLGDRQKVDTPQPSTPDAVFEVVGRLIELFDVDPSLPIGVTVPGVIQHGVVRSAANIDHTWIDLDADHVMEQRFGRPVRVLNDGDAAGYAEVAYGAAKDRHGVVLMTTLGTGIGTAIIHDGALVPNVELGVIELDGAIAEQTTGNAARERDGLSWEQWGVRLTRYYRHLERLFTPDLFVVGGGVSKSWDKFGHLIDIRTEIVPAALGNSAGVIGAALLALRDPHG